MPIVNPQKSNYQVWDGDAFKYNMNNDIIEKDSIQNIQVHKTFNNVITEPKLIVLSNGMCTFRTEFITGNDAWAESDLIFTLPIKTHFNISSTINIGNTTPTLGMVYLHENGEITTATTVGSSQYVNINFIFVPKN